MSRDVTARDVTAIDRRRHPFHLLPMPEIPPDAAGFSIARHVIQVLMRQALGAEPESVCGLVAGHMDTIEELWPCGTKAGAPDEARTALRVWEERGMHPLALYTSSVQATPPEKLHASTLRRICGDDADLTARLRPLPLLSIRLDVQGRLEAELFHHSPRGMRLQPLALRENGHLYPSGIKS